MKRMEAKAAAAVPEAAMVSMMVLAMAALILLWAGNAPAEPYTVYNYNEMHAQGVDNSSSLEDAAFFLVPMYAPNEAEVEVAPIKYVVWNQVQSMESAAQGVSLMDAFNGLGLMNTMYYTGDDNAPRYMYPMSLQCRWNEMDAFIELGLTVYHSDNIVNEPQYAPYAEYYVDLNTVRRHFLDRNAWTPFSYEEVANDMPFHIASTRESNTVRRAVDMSGQEALVARTAAAVRDYYAQRQQWLLDEARTNGWDAAGVPNDSTDEIYSTGHAFADVDGDGMLDFVVGVGVSWPNSPYECMEHPALVIGSSRNGVTVINEFGCTGTFPLGLADFNGDGVLDIATYSTFWEWDDMDVVTLAKGYPTLMGTETW